MGFFILKKKDKIKAWVSMRIYVMRKKKAGKIISHACVHEAKTF